jgi:hypothetical protein
MMIKGGIRIGGLGISGFDSDAAAYFERAGVTDATAKGQINSFVKGVKDLSLYNSMVCWPLRSAQNKGSGTTAYSLGGYGIFDGAIQASPSWTTTGLSFTSTSQYINIPYSSPLLSLVTSYAAFFSTSTAFVQYHVNFQNETAAGTYLIHRFDGTANGALGLTTRNSLNSFINTAARPINLTTFQSSAFSVASASDTMYQDGALAVSGLQSQPTRNPTATPEPYLQIAGNSSARTHAFQALFATTITDAQSTQINSLYKTTMGTGLGLP